MTKSTSTGNKPAYIAYHVRENKDKDAQAKGFWSPVGAAWKNKDDSITVHLECLPRDGRIVLRTPKEKVETEEQAA